MKEMLTDLLGIFLIFMAAVMFLFPDFLTYQYQTNADQEIKVLEAKLIHSKQKDAIYKKVVRYNYEIYKNRQKDMKDVKSYQRFSIGIKKDFGYLMIKKMKVKLPLYLGATKQNMSKGAAIMGETSIPIGTQNSNCVIAAHRGYKGIPYFREIEKLKMGDHVIIKNPWKKLRYKVIEIKIIYPDDLDEIRIQKGKEMITLLTCHPYQGDGKYRYIVRCIRDNGQGKLHMKNKVSGKNDICFQSSQNEIDREKRIRYTTAGLLLLIGIRKLKIFIKKTNEG